MLMDKSRKRSRRGMIMDLEKQKRIDRFNALVFLLDEEETDAVTGYIPMTQELYNSILNKCMGRSVDEFLNDMLLQYPDFMMVYAKDLEKELDEEYPEIEMPEETPEDIERMWENLCQRIRLEFGEDAI